MHHYTWRQVKRITIVRPCGAHGLPPLREACYKEDVTDCCKNLARTMILTGRCKRLFVKKASLGRCMHDAAEKEAMLRPERTARAVEVHLLLGL